MAISFLLCIKEYSKAGPGEYCKLSTYSYEMLLLHPARFVYVNKRETAIYIHIYIYIYENIVIFYARRAAPHQPIHSAAGAAKQRRDHRSSRVARQHGSTAAVESSLRLHFKINQKNWPGHSRIEASKAPGRLPGGSLGAPRHPQNIESRRIPLRTENTLLGPPHLC